jgi:hypothetical protein
MVETTPYYQGISDYQAALKAYYAAESLLRSTESCGGSSVLSKNARNG